MGLSIVREERGLSSANKGGGGSLYADVRTVWWKTPIFRNLWCVRTDKRESIFRDFVRTSFMDAPSACEFSKLGSVMISNLQFWGSHYA